MPHQKVFECNSLAFCQQGQLLGGNPMPKAKKAAVLFSFWGLPTQHPHKLNYEQIKGIQTEHSNSGNLNK